MEGKFGVNRPFGDFLSEFRPLIPSKFSDLPDEVASVATALDNSDFVKSVNASPILDSYMLDVIFNVKGVDNMSSSRLMFNSSGEFTRGSIRAGEVSLKKGFTEKGDVIGFWSKLLGDAGLDLDRDVAAIEMRENPGLTNSTVVPHVVFGTDGDTSPISTQRLLGIAEIITILWNERADKFTLGGRSDMKRYEGSESTEGTVSDMLDNL